MHSIYSTCEKLEQLKLNSAGDVIITVFGNQLALDPLCLIPAPGQVPDVSGGGDGGSDATSKVLYKQYSCYL